jgi:hypothetical protein
MTDPVPSKDQLRFSWTWDANARNWLIGTVDMGDGLLAGYDHFAGYYERRLIEEIERLRVIEKLYEEQCEAGYARGSAPEPAREYPDPVTAFEKLAEALPDGFQFPVMEPNNEPLTHMEILSAVHHHASEIVRLTAAVPVECSPQPPRDGQG